MPRLVRAEGVITTGINEDLRSTYDPASYTAVSEGLFLKSITRVRVESD